MWLYGVQFPTYKSSMCFVLFCRLFLFFLGGGVKSVKATPQGSGLLEVV